MTDEVYEIPLAGLTHFYDPRSGAGNDNDGCSATCPRHLIACQGHAAQNLVDDDEQTEHHSIDGGHMLHAWTTGDRTCKLIEPMTADRYAAWKRAGWKPEW